MIRLLTCWSVDCSKRESDSTHASSWEVFGSTRETSLETTLIHDFTVSLNKWASCLITRSITDCNAPTSCSLSDSLAHASSRIYQMIKHNYMTYMYMYMQLSRRDTFSWINIYFDHLWFYHFVQKVNEIWYLRSKIIAFPEYQMSLTSCTKLQTIKCKHLIKSILQEIVPFWKLGHVHVLHVHVIIRKERKKERKKDTWGNGKMKKWTCTTLCRFSWCK